MAMDIFEQIAYEDGASQELLLLYNFVEENGIDPESLKAYMTKRSEEQMKKLESLKKRVQAAQSR